MSERIKLFQKGDRPGASRLNELVNGVNAMKPPRAGKESNASAPSAFVKILSNATGDELYKGEFVYGQMTTDGTAALDLNGEPLQFTGTENCLIFNEAGDGQTGHSIEVGTIMRGFLSGFTSSDVPIWGVNPGGSPAAELPTPSYTGQVYQAVTDNVAAWQFPVSHTIP